MLRSHRRKTTLTTTALLATALLLTACQDGNEEDAAASNSPAVSDSAVKGESGGKDSATAQPDKASGGKVTGSWTGTVSFMASGKYMVTRKGGTGQAFFTSEDTDIEGAGKICGDAGGQAATPCSEDELEAASKKGFGATVQLKDGVAVSIIEDHADSGGGTDKPGSDETAGLVTGTLGYMAPGKYILTKRLDGGSDRSFFTSEDTAINGAGWICGGEDQQSTTTPCSEDDLEAAAKKGGIIVVADIKDGVATTIDENHN
ncbi:hypothetical protein [Streptomyces sp. NPDC058382]|uniref:hypothetical protein n=1 Tax=unclassified Streptomyces TaxID=2593676 RepID=UPI003643A4D5